MADADCLHLARHCAARAGVLRALLQRLATIPETVELARATGLTLGNILYNAQMIRTWSLLLRNAQRRGWVGAGLLLLGAAAPRHLHLLLEREPLAWALSSIADCCSAAAVWSFGICLHKPCRVCVVEGSSGLFLLANQAAVLASSNLLPSAQQVACSQATLLGLGRAAVLKFKQQLSLPCRAGT